MVCVFVLVWINIGSGGSKSFNSIHERLECGRNSEEKRVARQCVG